MHKFKSQISRSERIEKIQNRIFSFDFEFILKIHEELEKSKTNEEEKKCILKYIKKSINDCISDYISPTILHKEIKHINALVSEYAKGLKDKRLEIELSIVSLSEILKIINNYFLPLQKEKTEKLYETIVSRLYKILILASKIHSDLKQNFKRDLVKLNDLVGNNPNLMKIAIYNGFDVNWLIYTDIPLNIENLRKNLRANGYLK